jgi:hypothetical protein
VGIGQSTKRRRIELSRDFGMCICRIMARKEFGGEIKTSCMVLSDNDCYKYVARIRLVKTEKTSACVTVDCKVCRSAIALYCL